MPGVPFASVAERDIHFRKHGHEFGAANAAEYEQLADGFMCGALPLNVSECIRPNGTRRNRMHLINVHFGVAIVNQDVVVTFYIPSASTVKRHGGVKKLAADYCAKPD